MQAAVQNTRLMRTPDAGCWSTWPYRRELPQVNLLPRQQLRRLLCQLHGPGEAATICASAPPASVAFFFRGPRRRRTSAHGHMHRIERFRTSSINVGLRRGICIQQGVRESHCLRAKARRSIKLSASFFSDMDMTRRRIVMLGLFQNSPQFDQHRQHDVGDKEQPQWRTMGCMRRRDLAKTW